MDPAKVLRLVSAMGGPLRHVVIVGCEPSPVAEDDEFRMGLSPPVEAAIEQAVSLVESLSAKLAAEKLIAFPDAATLQSASSPTRGESICPP